MKKLACSSLIVAFLGLPLSLLTAGCSDDTGGNDAAEAKTKGTVAPGTPKDMEEYRQQREKATAAPKK